MTQVSFLYAGSPGVVARRTLVGDVLETRPRRDGGVDYLVKAPELNISKWVSAEFCTAAPRAATTRNAKATTVAEAAAVA